jgi:hypothetical protein
MQKYGPALRYIYICSESTYFFSFVVPPILSHKLFPYQASKGKFPKTAIKILLLKKRVSEGSLSLLTMPNNLVSLRGFPKGILAMADRLDVIGRSEATK